MSTSFGGSVKLTGESQYRQALKQISLELKEVDSELKVVTSQYDKNDKSQEALTAQSEALNKKLEAQAKKVGVLKDSYNAMSLQAEENKKRHEALKGELEDATKLLADVEKESGKDSQAYKDLAGYVANLTKDYEKSEQALASQEQALTKSRTEINNAQTAYNNTAKALEGLNSDTEATAKAEKTLGNNAETAGKQADKAGKGGFTVLKGILANLGAEALKAVPTALVNGLKTLGKTATSTIKDVTSTADEIAKGARNANLSAESYQSWSYILERSGSSIEGMRSAMLKLETASQNGNKAFKELGISSKELKSMSPEQTFERTISALQGIQDEGKRTVLASKLLGKGFGSELGSLLSMSAGETGALKQRVKDLGGVMSDEALKNAESFKDSLTDVKTSLTGLKNNLVSQFLPALKEGADGLADVFSGKDTEGGLKKISEAVGGLAKQLLDNAPAFMQTASTIFNSLLTAVSGALPQLSEALTSLISSTFPILSKLIIDGLPVVANAIGQLLVNLGAQLPTIIMQIFKAVEGIITQVTAWLTEGDNLEKFIDSLVRLAGDIASRLSELLPVLLPAVIKIISEVALALTKPENIEILLKAVMDIAKGIFLALVEAVPVLIDFVKGLIVNLAGLFADFLGKAVPFVANAIEKIVNTVKGWGNSIKTFIGNLISGIKSTVSSWITGLKESFINGFNAIRDGAKAIIDKVGSFVSSVFDTIKALPAKVVSIGANIASSIWDGIKSKMEYLKNKIKDFGDNIVKNIKKVFKIASPSKVTKQLGGYLAEGLGLGFEDEMRQVNKDIENSLPSFDALQAPTSVSTDSDSKLDYQTLVNALTDALTAVDVELDDIKLGKFVKKTVSNAIYT